MSIKAPADDWAELDRALAEFTSSINVEVHEDGEWLAEFAGMRCELHRHGKSPLVHLWSDQRNLARRVLRVRERSEDHVILEVQRFGRSKPGRLEFLRADSRRSPGRITREQFRSRLYRILAERFPDASVDSLTAVPDLGHSFSGFYVRGQMHEGKRSWAVMAVSPMEEAEAIEGMLAFGLLWLDWTRSPSDRRAVEGLRLLVPEGSSRVPSERVPALSSAARTEIYEFNEPESRMQKIDPGDVGNLEGRLIPRRETESTLAEAANITAHIRAIVPSAAEAISTRVPAGTREVALSFRGLEFARCTGEGVLFGIGDARQKLTDETEDKLERLIRQLDLHRNSLSEETNHPLYRAAPERWLETLVRSEATRLDAHLDLDHLYSQVPALAAGDRDVLDLLGVTNLGRLVVIELKASKISKCRCRPWIIGCACAICNRKAISSRMAISRARNWIPGRRWCGWSRRDCDSIPRRKSC